MASDTVTNRVQIPGKRGARTLLCLFMATAAIAEQAWQSPESITEAAEAYAMSRLNAGTSANVESAGVDARLRLSQCATALDTRVHGAFTAGRATIAVSCRSPQKWQIFVPVRVFQMIDVAVASRPIAAGEIIDAGAISLQRRSSAGLPHLYAEGLEGVIGQRARHAISSGSVIQMSALNVMKAVTRGAIVRLTTSRSGIAVHGQGEALEDGAIGERIRLKTAAGRVIEGTVESDSEVRVGG